MPASLPGDVSRSRRDAAPPLRVALIGNLAGYLPAYCRALRGRGIEAHLLLTCREALDAIAQGDLPRIDEDLGLADWVHVWDRPLDRPLASPAANRWHERMGWLIHWPRLLRTLRGYDVIHAHTLTPILAADSGRPLVAIVTGADGYETAPSPGLTGMLLRRAYRKAHSLIVPNALGWALDGLATAGVLHKCRFLPFGVELPESPGEAPGITDSAAPLRCFMPSRMDFLEEPARRPEKANDRFLRAAATVRREGTPLRIELVEHGPHLDAARQMVTELGLDDTVSWRPRLARQQLNAAIMACDLLVDQFAVGSWGTICLEAMAMQRAVLIHVEPDAIAKVYGEPMPILNARTEDEIAAVLRHAHRDRSRLADLGRAARAFCQRHHSWDEVCGRMADIYRQARDGHHA